ncbi:MAG: hypothetical protein LUD72_03955 [Bacteroidales bacterium]|nr:hypothetical protein [Bacteroidales bacterium]
MAKKKEIIYERDLNLETRVYQILGSFSDTFADSHAKEAKIACVRTNARKNSGMGQEIYADCAKVPDKYRALTNFDYVITLYDQTDGISLEAENRLLYHELLHIEYDPDKNERHINPHDVQDFRDCVDRWGVDWINV